MTKIVKNNFSRRQVGRQKIIGFARHRTAIGALGLIALGALSLSPAQAQDVAELRAQLKALEAKVAALEKSQSSGGSSDALREKLEKLPNITLDSKGINFSSPGIRTTRTEVGPGGIPIETTQVTDEGAFKLKIGGLLQPQARYFLGESGNSTSTFLARRARLNLEGTAYKNFDFKLQTDLQTTGSVPISGNMSATSVTTTVQDAYAGAKAYDWLQLRVGKMKSPLGIERWQSAKDRWFTDLITTTYIVPNRQIGAMLWGNVGDGLAEYYAGIFNGTPDGSSSNLSSSGQNEKDLQARLALTPFAKANIPALKKLTAGAGISYAPEINALGTYADANQQVFFDWNSQAKNNLAGLRQTRFVPNVQYFWGPFGLYGEAAWSTFQLKPASGLPRSLTNSAWQIASSYVVTGEDNSFRAISPRRKFSPSTGGWGALQLAGRVGQLTIDPDAFTTSLASNTSSAEESLTYGGAVNWILNDNVKFTLGYDYTSFVRGAAQGDRRNSSAVTSQLQFAF